MNKILFMLVLGMLAACSNPVEDLKSPCVGRDGSPCDRRVPSNQAFS